MAVVFCGSLLPVFAVRVSVMFHLTCVYIIFSSVRLLSGQLITRLTMCSLCILTICNISYFPFLGLRAGFGF